MHHTEWARLNSKKRGRGRYELNKLASLPMCGFIVQLVEHRTSIAEVTGSNRVAALIFFRLLLSKCLNWKVYCDDHSSLWPTTAVQIHELFHIIILHIIMTILSPGRGGVLPHTCRGYIGMCCRIGWLWFFWSFPSLNKVSLLKIEKQLKFDQKIYFSSQRSICVVHI